MSGVTETDRGARSYQPLLLLKYIAVFAGVVALAAAIPAALLYPVALWAIHHTHFSEYQVEQSYVGGIAMLLVPSLCLLEHCQRRFFLKRANSFSEGGSNRAK